MKLKTFSTALLTALIGATAAALLYHGCKRDHVAGSTEGATLIKYDTIRVTIDTPVPRESLVVRYEKVKLPVYDTLHHTHTTPPDSVSAIVPISQKHYSDSTYEAWVSGYKPTLDSIRIAQPVTTITHTTTHTEIRYKQKRWALGVQAGMGVTPHKIVPYVGVGVNYNIFPW